MPCHSLSIPHSYPLTSCGSGHCMCPNLTSYMQELAGSGMAAVSVSHHPSPGCVDAAKECLLGGVGPLHDPFLHNSIRSVPVSSQCNA
mmetsp:Transcript_21340/g.29356  ORF Transcript_21340/g.29356 Transcript_21340/m.29356 type:complete len:88 (+) Transcript_21340:871-1134(+)